MNGIETSVANKKYLKYVALFQKRISFKETRAKVDVRVWNYSVNEYVSTNTKSIGDGGLTLPPEL